MTVAAAVSSLQASPRTADAGGAEPAAVRRELVEAAAQFEAIFVRQLLKGVTEKLGSFGQSSASSTGAEVYGSMVGGALADSIVAGGGIGLADQVIEALSRFTPGEERPELARVSRPAAPPPPAPEQEKQP